MRLNFISPLMPTVVENKARGNVTDELSVKKHRNDFDATVFVAIGDSDQSVAVGSALQALELLSRWPKRDGAMYRHARHACVLAIAGSLDARVARKAFAHAVREAGILVEKHPPAAPGRKLTKPGCRIALAGIGC